MRRDKPSDRMTEHSSLMCEDGSRQMQPQVRTRTRRLVPCRRISCLLATIFAVQYAEASVPFHSEESLGMLPCDDFVDVGSRWRNSTRCACFELPGLSLEPTNPSSELIGVVILYVVRNVFVKQMVTCVCKNEGSARQELNARLRPFVRNLASKTAACVDMAVDAAIKAC